MAAAIPCRTGSTLPRRRAANSVAPLGPQAPALTQHELEPGRMTFNAKWSQIENNPVEGPLRKSIWSRVCTRDSPAEGVVLILLELAAWMRPSQLNTQRKLHCVQLIKQ